MIDDAYIVSVTGTADSIQLAFSKDEEKADYWNVSVPPETEDGVYCCSITAVTNQGYSATWNGWLYIFQGVCHLVLDERKFDFWIQDETITFSTECAKFNYITEDVALFFTEADTKVEFIVEKCPHNEDR